MIRFLTPKDLLSLVERSTRGGLANARTAAGAVTDAAAQRRALTDAVTPEGAPSTPGGLTRLSKATCLELVATRRMGRLAYLARAGTPDIVPVNFTLRRGEVLIRSGPGPKLQAAERRDEVAFEVDDIDEVAGVGWSVVMVGTARRLTAVEQRQIPAAEVPPPWAAGPRTALITLTPRRVDGRRLS